MSVSISWWRFLSVYFHLKNDLSFDNQVHCLWGLIGIIDVLISSIVFQFYVGEDRLDSLSYGGKDREAFDYFGLFILVHASQINKHALELWVLYLHHNCIDCCHADILFLLFVPEKRTPSIKLFDDRYGTSLGFHLPIYIPLCLSTKDPIIFIRN